LTQDAYLKFAGELKTEKFVLDTSGSYNVYKGVPMIIDQSVDTLNAHSAAGITCVDGDVFLGIAWEKKVVVSGDPETTEVELAVWPSIVGFKSSVFTNADLGKDVYMSDTATLSGTNGAYPRIGKLYKIEDGFAFVAIDSPYVLNVP
jgi:hypothetical protein